MRKLVLITNHARESAHQLGIAMPDEHFEFIIENRIRRLFHKAIKVKQGGRDRWILPLDLPESLFCDPICCWMVLAEPTNDEEKEEYQYILKTLLHENSPIVRKYWNSEDTGSPVEAYLRYCEKMEELNK